tara:strand:+ start:716 stop:2305 length:1590 start_codon:yes stop_codon:yes gene_type:complete
MKIDCIYYISLRQHTDEYKNQVLERISNLGIEEPFSYYLVKAVNGVDIPDHQRYTCYDSWAIPDEQLEGVIPEIKEFWNRDLTPGEIGCSLSHLHCWEDAMQAGHNNILILEEDFYAKAPLNLDEISSTIWDVFHLGRIHQYWYGNGDKEIPGQDNIITPSHSMNSHAYLLNRAGIEAFMSADLRANLIPVDEFISAMYYPHPREDIREMYPPVLQAAAYKEDNFPVGQSNNDSLTEPGNKYKLEDIAKKTPAGLTYHGEKSPDLKEVESPEIILEEKSFNPDQFSNLNEYINALRIHEFEKGFKPKHKFLYDYINLPEDQKFNFQEQHLHPDFMLACKNPSGYGKEWGFILEEPINDVLCFPFLKKSFCDAIIEECEHFNHFLGENSGSNSSDGYATTDVRFESMPGTESPDVAPIDLMYRDFLDTYISDIIKHRWRYTVKDIQETFVAKYEPDGQAGLGLHHDLATCACLVRLNDDYSGGGTVFEFQKTVVDPPVGYATIHPSRLTHRHGGRKVTSGTRYIIVTFID